VPGPKPDFVAAYREGLAAGAILIVRGISGVRIAVADYTGEAELKPDESVVQRHWCRRASHAESIVAAARSSRRKENSAQNDLSLVCDSIVRAARRLGISLLSDEDLKVETAQLVLRLDAEIATQMQAGTLKSVNKAYRHYRLETSARGERVVPYVQWMDRYKAKLLREIAANLR
jgi:hypothetical protein